MPKTTSWNWSPALRLGSRHGSAPLSPSSFSGRHRSANDLALSPLYAELTQGVAHLMRHADLAVPDQAPETSDGNLSRVHPQPRNLWMRRTRRRSRGDWNR